MHEPLTTAEIARYHDEGYLVREGWLDPDLARRLVEEVDAHAACLYPAYELPEHARLTSHPPLMTVIEQLLGPAFLFHHVHATRMAPGSPGMPWHHDFMQRDQRTRSHGFLVAFIFPAGVRSEVGDLVVVPRTQRIVSDMHALSLFSNHPLPGEVVIDHLAPGSIVLANTALLHCRRARPGPGPRYLSDVSYCQRGIMWPSWLQGDWQAMYRRLREQGCEREGRYAHLYDPSQFYDARSALAQPVG